MSTDNTDTDTDYPAPSTTHPRGHCDDCGERLLLTPCPNCGQLEAMDREH